MELRKECLPTQRSLGVCWNLHSDEFTFRVTIEDKPFTRRGVLSSINSLFDPLGLTAPVTIAGKSLLREAMTGNYDSVAVRLRNQMGTMENFPQGIGKSCDT